MPRTPKSHSKDHGECLIAIVNRKRDLAIALNDRWYRIPVESAPKPWPPRWLALYQTAIFGDDAFAVRHYGEIAKIEVVRRRELFPNEFGSHKSDREYYKLTLRNMGELVSPIFSLRRRRIVFIPTTLEKFHAASEINDLFNDSPLENHLWDALKRHKISAERQFELIVEEGRRFYLDFMVTCAKGKIAIETDGKFHHTPEKAEEDDERDRLIQRAGYETLRFNYAAVMERTEKSIYEIQRTANKLGGVESAAYVPAKRLTKGGKTIEQPSIFSSMVEDEDDDID
jgi:very-short-patch-repair endonuclease